MNLHSLDSSRCRLQTPSKSNLALRSYGFGDSFFISGLCTASVATIDRIVFADDSLCGSRNRESGLDFVSQGCDSRREIYRLLHKMIHEALQRDIISEYRLRRRGAAVCIRGMSGGRVQFG